MYRRQAKRERVTIQTATRTQQPNGSYSTSAYQNVTNYVNIPASFEYIRGMEKFRGRQVQAEVHGVFEIRHTDELTTEHFVVHVNQGNKRYGIVSVEPVLESYQGGRYYTLIFVKAIA